MVGRKRSNMTRKSRTAAIAVLLMAMAATPSASSFSFPNSSLWRERYVGHHQVEQPQEKQQPDYYRILGVGRQASRDDIKTAFRQLVKQYHPDANPNVDTTEQFQIINKAYHILNDPQKRTKYNSQTCHFGLASDTPHFIMDAFETDTYAQPKKSTSDTNAVRYQPIQIEPNDNGRGSLFQKDDKEDQANPYRISSY